MPRHSIFFAIYGLMFLAALYFGVDSWRALNHSSIVVEWTTASELNTAGFNLYRSESPGGTPVRLNDSLIPASPDPLTGGSYKFEDRGVAPGHTYYYVLEDVEFSGATTRSEPIKQVAERGGVLGLAVSALLAATSLFGFVTLAGSRRDKSALAQADPGLIQDTGSHE